MTTQPDPFADPTILAFPANPLLVQRLSGKGVAEMKFGKLHGHGILDNFFLLFFFLVFFL